jgi:hypothetical protein
MFFKKMLKIKGDQELRNRKSFSNIQNHSSFEHHLLDLGLTVMMRFCKAATSIFYLLKYSLMI